MASATLPLDIILDVLDRCYFSPSCIPDYPTLRALCLVSQRFTRNAQALLFRNVFLWRDSLAHSFGAALNPAAERGQWLATRVRFLRAIVRPSGSRDGHGLSQRTFLAVIRACPHLREIDMDPRRGFEPHLFSAMRLYPPPVEALRFHITDMQQYLIIDLFPKLKYLQIKDAGHHLVPRGAPPPTCALRELHWRGDASAAEWILRGSVGTLEILTFEAPITCLRTFRSILRTHGPSLRSLTVQKVSPELVLMLMGDCVRLEEFCYDAFPTAAVLDALPPTLEHLQFTGGAGCGKPAMQNLLSFIRVAPSLLNVTYCPSRWESDDPYLLRWLGRSCEKYLIVFFHLAPPFGSFPGERIEFGPVSRFPRPLILSSLRLQEPTLEDRIYELDRVPTPAFA